MINKVTLIGNLGKDPEVRILDSGTKVAKFPMATNENYKDKSGEWQTKTEWHDVVLWRGLAEQAERQLKKGSLVYVEGKLTSRKYQDRDGNDRYITEIVARIIRSLDRKESGGMSSSFPSSDDDPFSGQDENVNNSGSQSSGNEPDEDDDLPF
ncbi:single-stranded DNA-binding protein [Membranihabitans maritimus]|uniref:single-stranded DNA-binding protein n=1 Tax=Membranihabitans maritimus TaxID=2904244 RepID=UPI001F0272C5|nr:single-stranded DNA-binding protein [Membranihabitans maritimus]